MAQSLRMQRCWQPNVLVLVWHAASVSFWGSASHSSNLGCSLEESVGRARRCDSRHPPHSASDHSHLSMTRAEEWGDPCRRALLYVQQYLQEQGYQEGTRAAALQMILQLPMHITSSQLLALACTKLCGPCCYACCVLAPLQALLVDDAAQLDVL